MSKYIGTIGQRITSEVTLVNTYEYKDYKFSYYGTTHYIYTFKDAEDNILVWKTTSWLFFKEETKDFDYFSYAPKKGDKIKITGTVKAHSKYNDIEQTTLNRCKCSLIEKHQFHLQRKNLKQRSVKNSLLQSKMVMQSGECHISSTKNIIQTVKQLQVHTNVLIVGTKQLK